MNPCKSHVHMTNANDLILLSTLLSGEFLTVDVVSECITAVNYNRLTCEHPTHPDVCAAA